MNPSTKAQLTRLELRKQSQTEDTIRFNLCLVDEETGEVLTEEKGWRVWKGKVQPPCTLFRKRYVSTVVVSPRVQRALDEMVLEWLGVRAE